MLDIKKNLVEIKNRCMLVLASWCTLFITSYYNKEIITYIVLTPVIGVKKSVLFYFIFTNITEIFFTYIKLVVFISNHCFLFIGYYQLINFILPGLYSHESKKLKTTFYYMIFWWAGFFYFWYQFFISISWKFFLTFQNSYYKITNILFNFELKFNEYVDFFIKTYLINITASHFFTILFLLIEHSKKKNFFFFKYNRKDIYLTILIISTLISTPELLNQILLSIYYIIFFELMGILLFIKNKKLILN